MSGGIEKLFIDVMNMSLTGCVVILAVILVRLLLRRAPRIFSYALWIVVLFRLLCPISFVSEFSLLGLLQSEPAQEGRMIYIPEDIGLAAQPQITFPAGALEDEVNASLPAATMTGSVNPMQIVLYVGARIWVLGMLVMAGYSGYALFRLQRRLRAAVWERGNIYRLPGTGTPFVYGLFRPRIYYPCSLDGEEKDYILIHEQIHIRRGDHVTRVCSYLALCIHWFNPLVWVAYVLSGRDMEMSCDEAVLRRMGNAVKKEYSASLLALASGSRHEMPLAFGERDTGSRIKNVLRYRKPGVLAAGVVGVICAAAAVLLLANPGGEPTVYYGVVETVDFDGSERGILWVPGIGEMDQPQVNDIMDLDPEAFSGLIPGWLLRMTFPAGEEVGILETWPGQFSVRAERIEIVGEGFAAETTEGGRCRIALPMNFSISGPDGERIQEPVTGDVLRFSDTKERQVAVAETVLADSGTGQLWMELSQEEAGQLFAAYESGLRCEVVLEAGLSVAVDTEEEEEAGQAEDISGTETDEEQTEGSDGIWSLGPERVVDGRVADGTYRVYVRSISRSLRGIDLYVAEGWGEDEEPPELVFDDDCSFWVNVEMDSVRYEEREFDEFADLVSEAYSYLNPPLRLVFEEGSIVQAYLDSAYYGVGIAYAPVRPAIWSPEDLEGITGEPFEDVLAEYYVLAIMTGADISDAEGTEVIGVYTGNIGDGDSGIVLCRSQDGTILYGDGAHAARAGWNNIYLGERDGISFLMTMHIEDRGTYGEYAYYVFRLGEEGEIKQIAGSVFTFRDGIKYDDGLFEEWVGRLMGYLADSRLLLSSQEMELRTEWVSEADKYNYETLRRSAQ